MAPSDLPMGVSPDEQDNQFRIGAVQTRPGLTNVFAVLLGNPTVNYLKTFVMQTLQKVMLELDSLGRMWAEQTAGALTQINFNYWSTPGNYAQSATQFGREYIALSDGQFGIDIPRQWDGTNWDRVSQDGPGAFGNQFPMTGSGQVSDVSFAIVSISRASGIVSAETNAPHGLVVGGLVTIQGVEDATFNGTFPVSTVPTATTFTSLGNPGIFAINTLIRAAGTVTAVLATGGTNLSPGDAIIVHALDSSFDGQFNAISIDGNTVTWAQAGSNANSTGTLYTIDFTLPILGIYPAINPPSGVGFSEINFGYNISDVHFVVGSQIAISGNTDSSYNVTWTVLEVLTAPRLSGQPAYPSNTFVDFASTITTTGYGGIATSVIPDATPTAAGVAGPGGTISQGVHQVTVLFVTRQGYLTRPAPPIEWLAQGGFTAQVTGITVPQGMTNIVARILAFTTAGGDTFYYISSTDQSNMVIMDAFTTINLTVDFTDTQLASGTDISNLFDLVTLEECVGTISYGSRQFWWGERNSVQNFENLSFNGGWNTAVTIPLGWMNDPNADPSFANGSTLVAVAPITWGGALYLYGDGVTETRGLIVQGASKDYLGATIIQGNTPYSVRFLARAAVNLTQGFFNVELYSPSLGSLGVFQIAYNQVTSTTWTEFSGPICPAILDPPDDLLLRVYVSGTVNSASGFIIAGSSLSIFPTNQPYNTTLVRGSYVEDPESFDGVTGFMNVAPENGQAMRAAFVLREKLYLVKQRSMFSTEDDAQNEPSGWTITEISNTVGTESVNGVAVGEEYAMIANRSGAYIFWGPEPVKISQEIQPDWDQINWAAASTIWTVLDTKNRRVLFGVPLNGATKPTNVLMCDFRGCGTAAEIAEADAVHISSYSGKILSLDKGRKWSKWTIAANSGALIERQTLGVSEIFLGNNVGNGKTYFLDDANLTDDGAAIPSYYWTFFFLSHDLEQQLQVGAHRKLYYYLVLYVEGQGKLVLTGARENLKLTNQLPILTLQSPANNDLEVPINLLASRAAFKMAVDGAVGSWYKIQRFIPSIKPDPFSPVRGVNNG